MNSHAFESKIIPADCQYGTLVILRTIACFSRAGGFARFTAGQHYAGRLSASFSGCPICDGGNDDGAVSRDCRSVEHRDRVDG